MSPNLDGLDASELLAVIAQARARLGVADVLRERAASLADLRARGIVRTDNDPLGDVAERVWAKVLGVPLLASSSRDLDLRLTDGTGVQVKARAVPGAVADRLRSGAAPLSLWPESSPCRAGETGPWPELLALLILDRDRVSVVAAALVPGQNAEGSSRWANRVAGHLIRLSPALLSSPGAVDYTEAAGVALERLGLPMGQA